MPSVKPCEGSEAAKGPSSEPAGAATWGPPGGGPKFTPGPPLPVGCPLDTTPDGGNGAPESAHCWSSGSTDASTEDDAGNAPEIRGVGTWSVLSRMGTADQLRSGDSVASGAGVRRSLAPSTPDKVGSPRSDEGAFATGMMNASVSSGAVVAIASVTPLAAANGALVEVLLTAGSTPAATETGTAAPPVDELASFRGGLALATCPALVGPLLSSLVGTVTMEGGWECCSGVLGTACAAAGGAGGMFSADTPELLAPLGMLPDGTEPASGAAGGGVTGNVVAG